MVSVRVAVADDLPRLKELWLAFEGEVPPPAYADVDHDEEFREIEEIVRDHVALLAVQDDEPVGFLLGRMKGSRRGYVSDLYVAPGARRRGAAAALMVEAASVLSQRGAEIVELEVQFGNEAARAVYERWGFRETHLVLAVDVEDFVRKLGEDARSPSLGRVYVQTDDATAIERAVAQFVPRLGRSEHTVVHPPANGWVSVEDELCSREPKLLRRLAQELSYRTGGVVLSLGVEEGAVVRYILFDRGLLADEYASVPEHFGPLPPGDVVALAANPTVVARLTGADPGRVRAVARTASSPEELPPPDELHAQIVGVLGLGSA